MSLQDLAIQSAQQWGTSIGHAGPPNPRKQSEPNSALREIANRLQRLSYRDMQVFSRTLSDKLGVPLPVVLSECILAAADELENA